MKNILPNLNLGSLVKNHIYNSNQTKDTQEMTNTPNAPVANAEYSIATATYAAVAPSREQ